LRGGGSAFGSAGVRPRGESGQAQQLARVVFALLVVACFAAFVATQRLKHTPTAVQNFEMDEAFRPTDRRSASVPAAGCRGRVPTALVNATKRIEYLSFKPAQAERVTVEIVNSAEADVATIVKDLPVERYKQLSLCWNGQRGPTESGGLAPPGEYRLRVSLLGQGRTVRSPRGFTLEAGRP
jgi:hypothetical protein